MIRRALQDDVLQIAATLHASKRDTGWAGFDHPGWNLPDLIYFINGQLLHPFSAIFVSEHKDSIQAFCAGSLDRTMLPPHLPFVREWGWWQDGHHSREAIQCLRALGDWGRARGAVMVGYTQAKVSLNKKKIFEPVTWRVL